MNIERKRVDFVEINVPEAKAEGDAPKEMRFKGYGAVFGNMDAYGDIIEQGAFEKTLKQSEKSGNFPSMLLQHGGWGIGAQDLMPVGVWDTLKEDTKGLASEGILADIQRGQEAYTLLKMKPRPAITGLSIGYIPKKFTVGTKADEPRRLLHEIELIEISLVTFPANAKARVTGVKSLEDFSERDFERLMQDAGLSRSEARVVINHGFKHLKAMQDAGSGELDDLAAAIKRNTQLLTQHT
jgi:HK97 family phage prohead protease